jgi:hypothetical protein
MHASYEYNACIMSTHVGQRGRPYTQSKKRPRRPSVAERTIQFTVRSVPGQVEKALKRKAAVSGKSLNRVLVEALSREAGVEQELVYRDLDSLAGTWEDDPDFDETLRAQDQIDEGLWK